ncbi:3'(2'),5'-bisphosphate nucleotidase CysQ [Sphingorhabdus lutea]
MPPIIDIDLMVHAVRGAGDIAMQNWRQDAPPNAKIWEKSKGHPVCDVDIAVDEALKKSLGALLPDAGWLSEETADNLGRVTQKTLWIVDPIDGTRDYIRGRRGWCVSAALIHDGTVMMGILYAPAMGDIWMARRGHGAWRNGRRLYGSNRQEFVGARVPAHELPKIDQDLTLVPQPNSIALRMAMVADDEADLVATLRWGNEWDIAAAHLIAAEAGCKVTTALGDEIIYNKPDPLDFGLITSARDIHQSAIQRLNERAKALL